MNANTHASVLCIQFEKQIFEVIASISNGSDALVVARLISEENLSQIKNGKLQQKCRASVGAPGRPGGRVNVNNNQTT